MLHVIIRCNAYVYNGLQRCGHMYNSCPLCFLFSSICNLKLKVGKINVAVVFNQAG